MLKTLNTKSAEPRKGGVGIDDVNRVRRAGSEIDDGKKIDGDKVDSAELEDDEVEKKVQKTSKSKNLSKSKTTVRMHFFIPKAKLAFTKLRQAFLKVLIFYHFDLECHIQIEIDISGYAIGGVFS